ncbi:HSPB1-associated protein 1 homolog isoform X1 [Erpetoichthys calabaricus]|uniref:HSPB1-associated protein 1 homolog isoform X1 n=1 Tax=Erpetoichthys calabaricus TaxID=27687 RepID=UPI00223442C4|nr:HSPB1-associated protein 1 homolog isoform X1 [Erpetoichthys calabaricus]XP_028663906.2 HSPB1-associated protein 1 homolog isoform X1 [Erpetoichthys calabaricus]XP_051786279.1 HSPB1-associated protein 1 homolog isoform X1 [Erpetoichthys calabaricus]
MSSKPYTPQEARQIVESLKQPAVFCNMASDWPALKWNVEYLVGVLRDKPIQFRIGKRLSEKAPQFETQCSYIEATLQEFMFWGQGLDGAKSGALSDCLPSEMWAYADYKYIAMLFAEQASLYQDIKWSDFGFPGRDGRASTLWIGTEGANTPCHLDTYGCNLVLQVQGRKRWLLFPPNDTPYLYPTRIPYEESSVFSKVNVANADLQRFPAFINSRAHVVTLHPGQVLFIPRHWWHYVESIDPFTVSINSWIEMDVDDEVRVEEAITKTVVCALKSAPSLDNADNWLNPTEDEATSHEENLHYLSLAVQTCLEKKKHRHQAQADTASEAGSPGSAKKRKRSSSSSSFQVERGTADVDGSAHTFGPHLVLVPQVANSQNVDDAPETCNRRSSKCSSPHRQGDGHSRYELSCDRAAESDKPEPVTSEPGGQTGDTSVVTTNLLLDCLLHPDIISLVTKLLLDKASGQ